MSKTPREIIDELLHYAVKFAQDEEQSHDDCWATIDAARDYLEQSSQPGMSAANRSAALEALKQSGLTLVECIRAFAVSNDDPYVKKARDLIRGDEDIGIDDDTTTSVGENGAWVLNWLWVSNEEAGILAPAELLETVLDHARKALASKHGLDAETMKQLKVQSDWLEDLISNYADELDEIETEVPKGQPGPINWHDAESGIVNFMPSDALNQLRLLARQGGLPDNLADQAEKFCIRYGNKIDAILTVVHIP